MAANIETMFYAWEKPWHGLAGRVMEAPTSKDALQLADVDRTAKDDVLRKKSSCGQKKLDQYFCWKLSRELNCFKAGVLQHSKEEIFSMAYQIDAMVSLYELLVEMSQKMNSQELQKCIRVTNLLAFLYHGWLQMPDSQMDEMEQAIIQQIQNLARKAA